MNQEKRNNLLETVRHLAYVATIIGLIAICFVAVPEYQSNLHIGLSKLDSAKIALEQVPIWMKLFTGLSSITMATAIYAEYTRLK